MEDVTVILTIWKRNYLEEQVQALLDQSIKPKTIILYQCGRHVDVGKVLKRFAFLEHIHSSIDLGYFGRFSMARFSQTPYTYILDDDVIPGRGWISQCMALCQQNNAIVSSAGRILPAQHFSDRPSGNDFVQKYFVGDNTHHTMNFCETHTWVDFGCNSWFFKTQWIEYFWAINPYTLKNGEDMHLSATCKILHDIQTIVPRQVDVQSTGNLKKGYGFDNFASWKKDGFFDMRSEIMRYLINEKNWCPLQWTKHIVC